MKDRSDDLSHHEWTLLPQSYISLLIRTMFGRGVGGGCNGHVRIDFQVQTLFHQISMFLQYEQWGTGICHVRIIFLAKTSTFWGLYWHAALSCHLPPLQQSSTPSNYLFYCWSLPRSGPTFPTIIFSTALVFEETCILKMGYTLIWLSSCVTREVWTGWGLSGFVIYNSPKIDFIFILVSNPFTTHWQIWRRAKMVEKTQLLHFLTHGFILETLLDFPNAYQCIYILLK